MISTCTDGGPMASICIPCCIPMASEIGLRRAPPPAHQMTRHSVLPQCCLPLRRDTLWFYTQRACSHRGGVDRGDRVGSPTHFAVSYVFDYDMCMEVCVPGPGLVSRLQ